MQNTSLFRWAMGPGEWLVMCWRMPAILTLLGALVGLPLLWFATQEVGEAQARVETMLQKRQGAATIQAITSVIIETQKHRGQTNAVLSGDASAVEIRRPIRTALRLRITALDHRLDTAQEPRLSALWVPIRKSLTALLDDLIAVDRESIFDLHTAQIRELEHLIELTTQLSGLLYGSNSKVHLLTDLVVSRFVPLIEPVGLARGAGAGLLSNAAFTQVEAQRVRGFVQRLRAAYETLQWRLESMASTGIDMPSGTDDLDRQLSRFLDSVDGVFGRNGTRVLDAQTYFDYGTDAISAATAFKDAAAALLEAQLTDRINQARMSLWLIIGVGLIMWACVGYILTAFFRTTTRRIARITHTLNRAASGDLRTVEIAEGSDELAEVATLVQQMIDQLSMTVQELRQSATSVYNTGEALVDDADVLSASASSQVASLRQSSEAIGGVTDTVAHSTARVQLISKESQALRHQAEHSGQQMTQLVSSLETVQFSVSRMNTMLETIDGLSTQTSILALNAAVEAARAGQSGKGFAVVAQEVGVLAQHSKTAAAEIREQIELSRNQVRESVQQVNIAHKSFSEILERLGTVACNIDEIAEGSAKQSAALQQVAQTLVSLDQSTQDNAALYERSALNAQQLRQQSESLNEAVAHIQAAQDCRM